MIGIPVAIFIRLARPSLTVNILKIKKKLTKPRKYSDNIYEYSTLRGDPMYKIRF